MYRETIRKALEAKRAEAQTKWTEFDEARKAIQAEGFDPTKDKDAFEKAHELQKAYALIAEGEGGVRDLTAQYEKALDIDGAPKPDNTPFTPEGEAGTKAWQSPGDRVLASENYKGLRDSGVLNMQQGRINMNPVKAMERDEYVDFLKSGISPMGNPLPPGVGDILARYQRGYPTAEARGTLTYSEIEVRPLGEGYALVLGRFALKRTQAGGGDAAGRFTLVFRRTAQGWKIIHDHSS